MMRRLRLDTGGNSAAEFALVLPLLMIALFGIIDGGIYFWEVNKAEKATQMGARFAVVTDPVAQGLVDEDYVGQYGLTQGDVIPATALDPVVCTDSGDCSCTGNCPGDLTRDSAAFDAIVDRMQMFKQDITAAQVIVTYTGSGVGYAGDPNGMEIAPLVTVELDNATFTPLTSMLFGGISVNLPTFRTTLTAEDSSGSTSN